MPLVAFSVRLDKIDEGLLYKAADGSYWLSCVCVFETDAKNRTLVVQSIPPERYKAGERGPQVGHWREIGGKDKPPASGGKGFDLAKFRARCHAAQADGRRQIPARRGGSLSRWRSNQNRAHARPMTLHMKTNTDPQPETFDWSALEVSMVTSAKVTETRSVTVGRVLDAIRSGKWAGG